ncbi:MAG: MBL fold metallo-hydrolase [Spirochaetota bacterium]
MEIRFFGTGTSHGIPVIGCECNTCTSTNPKNTRYRTCVHVLYEDTSLLIDVSPEFRLQAIKYKLQRVDGILFTHAHSDHCSGLDDIRRYNELQESAIPVYGNGETLLELQRKFSYIFRQTQEGGGKPKITLAEAQNYQEFSLGGVSILPLPVLHGSLEIFGYRIGRFAFITDVTEIPEQTFACLQDLDVLVLDALRHRPHTTHFTLQQAIEAATRISAKKTYFTHMSHELEHEETEKTLPESMYLSYDGLCLQV